MSAAPPRVPPRFVPTLTEVVEQPAGAEGSTFQARWADLEEPLVQRILQRVDVALERRVREVMAQVVREQTQAMLPRLRDEIEAVVRQAINDAVAQELDTK
ncbi:MAG: hypothetical protein V4562_01620 [Pseudomonadota bacterium]